MQDLTPDEKVMLELERRMAQDSQTRAVRDRLFRNSPQLATIGADGKIQALVGDDAPAEFMPNLFYGQGEVVDYTPVQGGLGKADKKSFIGAAEIAATQLVFPAGTFTEIAFITDSILVQVDSVSELITGIASNLIGGSANYFVDNSTLDFSFPFGIGSYNGVLSTYPSGDGTAYLSYAAEDPYLKWAFSIGCQDGYALTPSCDEITIQGLRINEGDTYELQGFAGLNGGALVEYSSLYTAVGETASPTSIVRFVAPTITSAGLGDSTVSCAALGLTTLEWAWKWRKQGEDWFVL